MDPRGIAGLTLQLHTDSTHQPTSGGRGCGYLCGGDTWEPLETPPPIESVY